MPHNPHDAPVKRVFSDVENAVGELRTVLPAALAAAVDFGTLRLEAGSFVDEELAASHTDLLYSVELEGRDAFVLLLFEHQSTADPLMAYRLLRYTCRIWERWLGDNPTAKRLPAIVSVVLHHGPRPWSAARRLHDLLDLPAEVLAGLGRHAPELELVLDDLNQVSDEELERRQMTAYARLVLWCLRMAGRGRPARDAIELFARLSSEIDQTRDGREALVTILRYLGDVLGDERDELIDAVVVAEGGDAVREANVTYNERIREEARQEGREEGRRSLLLKLLTLKFGAVSAETERRLAAASEAELEQWAERVLTATSVNEVWE